MSIHPYRNYFKEFKGDHKVFIETGSWKGDSIELARQAGYDIIRSMDIDPGNIAHCGQRFALGTKNRHISLLCGDSTTMLLDLMTDINESAMIWLDAHSQLFDDEQPTENPFPLLLELEQLKKHPIKTHTIIIDDILILTHPDVTGWNRAMIENALLGINTAYKLTYLSNPVVNNILMAHV